MLTPDDNRDAAKALLEAKTEAARSVATWAAIILTMIGASGTIIGFFFIRELDALRADVRRLEEWRTHQQQNLN